jgi:hypothetical protein
MFVLLCSSFYSPKMILYNEEHNRHTIITIIIIIYEGESNENRKTEIQIRNIAPLSYKLADMLPML